MRVVPTLLVAAACLVAVWGATETDPAQATTLYTGCNKQIAILVDTSGSIGSLGPSIRMTAGAVMNRCLTRGARVTVATFASDAELHLENARRMPTDAINTTTEVSTDITNRLAKGGFTNLLAGLEVVYTSWNKWLQTDLATSLGAPAKDFILLVLTDGNPNWADKTDTLPKPPPKPRTEVDFQNTVFQKMFGPQSELKAKLRVMLFGEQAKATKPWELQNMVTAAGGVVAKIPDISKTGEAIKQVLNEIAADGCRDPPEFRVYFDNDKSKVFDYYATDSKAFPLKWPQWKASGGPFEKYVLCSKERPGEFHVVGLASKAGNAAHNKELSQARALAVTCYMTQYALKGKCANYSIKMYYGGDTLATLPKNADVNEQKVDRYVAVYAGKEFVPGGVEELRTISTSPDVAAHGLPTESECSSRFLEDTLKQLNPPATQSAPNTLNPK